MRIHRISLRDFRGVDSSRVEPALTGVTIVQGPNEVGKTSLADALDMLLADPDSSGKARVKAAQPFGRDVGPWVEADIESGPYRFTYSKQWVKGTATELHVTSPATEQLTGRKAHDRVLEILGETMDVPLFEALRHQQGLPLDQATLAGSASLARALDRAAGGATRAADGDSALIDAIDAERQVWSTPTGEPNKARKDLREALDEAQQQLAAAEAALHEVDARVERHGRFVHDIARNEDQEPGLRKGVADLEALQAGLLRRQEALRRLEVGAERAEGPKRDADAALAARWALIEGLAEVQAHEQALSDEGQAAGGALAQAVAARDAAATDLATAVAAREAADARFTAADADDGHLRNAWDLGDLRERRDRVAQADTAIAEADAFIAGCAVTDQLLDQLEQAVIDHAGAQGRVQGAGARLTLAAERDLRVRSGDGTVDVPAGGDVTVAVGAGEALHIEGVARVAVEGSGDDLRAEAERAAQALQALLATAGVGDGGVEAARAQARRRHEAEARAQSARQARQTDLKDLTPQEMHDKIARAEARVAEYLAGRDAASPLPDDREAAQQARAAADAARAESRRAEDRARDAHAAAEKAVNAQEGEARERTGRLQATRARVQAAADALDEARAATTDDALLRAADDARQAAEAARQAFDDEARALGADDADAVQVRLENARQAVDRLLRERNEMEVQAARLLGEIATAGDEGRADRADRARAALQHAQAQLDAAERRAAAADLLYEVITRHRDDARRAYVAPFRQAVEQLGRLVFGGGMSVEVDHATLQVTSRTQDGVTVPVEALSGGAREQLAVIGRLAAASLVAPDGAGGAPVVIDDALGYSDPSRLEGLGAALAEAGETCQVIVLTCVPERYARIGSARTVRL